MVHDDFLRICEEAAVVFVQVLWICEMVLVVLDDVPGIYKKFVFDKTLRSERFSGHL